MFEYDEKTGTITAIRGNSGVLETVPYNAETEEEIILDENDKILFCIKTPSGRTIIKKIITMEEYNDEGKLILNFTPTDLLIQPFIYTYGFTYVANDNAEAQTYAQGNFIVLDSCGTIEDLTEQSVTEPEQPEDSVETVDTSEDNTTETESGGTDGSN